MNTYLMVTYWHWWGLAALCIVGELLSPCVYFLAWAVAAAVTGLAARLLPGMPGLWQIGLFILLSAATLSLAYYIRGRKGLGKKPAG